MKIHAIIEQFELLYENFNITQMTVDQMGIVHRFLQSLVYEHLPEKMSDRQGKHIAGYIDQLRKKEVRNAVADISKLGGPHAALHKNQPVKSDRSQRQSVDASPRSFQARAYGFGPEDPYRDISLTPAQLKVISYVADALEEIDAYDVERATITDRDTHALISAFLGNAANTPIIQLADKSTFTKYAEELLHKRQSEIQSASEVPDSVTRARNLDLDAYLFLISMQKRQARQKEAWASYLNPVAVNLFKKKFNKDLDYEAASDALISAGFIKRTDSGYMPDWNEIKSFQDELLKTLTSAISMASEHGMRVTSGGQRGIAKKEEAFVNMMNSIKRLVPNKMVKLAEGKVISIMKELTAEGQSDTKSVVNAFLARAESLQDLPENNQMHIFIKNTITMSTIKVVANMIVSMVRGSSDINVRGMVLRDMRPMLQNIGKQMKAPR